jgi:hypothetical protein
MNPLCQIKYVSSDSDIGTPCGKPAVAKCSDCGTAREPVKTIVTILLLVGSLFAQASIQDVSAAGSPLSLSGTAADILGLNVSQKEILLYVVAFKAVNSGVSFRHDYYFKPNGVLPNTTENVGEISPKFAAAGLSQASVQYVQFVDGSEWGDRTVGAPVLGNRQPILGLLSQVSVAYDSGGESAFAKLLNSTKDDAAQPDAVRSMARYFLRMETQTGIDAALVHLKGRIGAAVQHDRTLAGH